MDDERYLIVCNLLNGLTHDQVGITYKKSFKEVDDIFKFVIRKIKSYCFARSYPFFACDSLLDARRNKHLIIYIMNRLNLKNDTMIYSKVETISGFNEGIIRDIAHRNK